MQAQEKAEFGRIPLLWLRLHVQNVMETLASVTSAWVYMNSEIISNFPNVTWVFANISLWNTKWLFST